MTGWNRIERGAGTPLVLLHGGGSSANCWLPVIGQLAKKRRVIAFDFPGFGDTPAAAVAQETPGKRALANWAFDVGRARARAQGDSSRLRYALADRLVLSAIRRRIGLGKIRIAVTGAAPIPTDVHEFILGLGIDLCEGYGMSECTAGATVSRPGSIKIGTVGTTVPGAEVSLAARRRGSGARQERHAWLPQGPREDR